MAKMIARASAFVFALLLAGACQAPPPPVAVDTPFGLVRAESEDKAEEVAEMLADLAPRLREELPGTLDREIDVWVQSVLRSTRHGERAKGVKGFTLLAGEFKAKRIHLLEDGELSWYLAHELVHALVDRSWAPLPGILEEGLGDVVAEELNPEHAQRIRAHRLFTSSGFFGGVLFRLAYHPPDGERRSWVETPMRLSVVDEVAKVDVVELLSLSRSELRDRWSELPEPFYGLAYMIVSRIVERHGFDGLHTLCLVAGEDGHEVIPTEQLMAAAELDPEAFEPGLLSEMFGRAETRQLLMMQPEMFAETVASFFRENYDELSTRELLYHVNPCLRSSDGSLVRLRSIWPVRQRMIEEWRDGQLAAR
ncbi:MAG: hypothetical protein AAF682_29775 [Planctomycetota bacterium]